jgi:outer membrane protein TolC
MRKKPSRKAGKSLLGLGWWIAAGLVAATVGCRAPRTIRDPEFAALAVTPPVACASAESVAAAVMPVAAELSGPRPVDEYIAFALCQNPEIQVKRKRVEAAAMRVPQAASLEDPLLDVNGWPLYAHAPQQAGGRMTVDVMASQQVPWFGKLRARASAAEAEADAACAELAAAELQVVEQVKRAYYELYLVQTATEITQQSRNLAVEFGKIAEAKYRTGLVDQQDLLRAQLEISNVDVELVRMRQELLSAQARLARLLHVSPETPVRALAELPEEQVPGDIERLYALAIEARPDLHSQLAAIRRDRFNVDLARLQYFPDLTLKFGWGEMTTSRALAPTADGWDNLSLGIGANIPIYRKRLEAGVREAEAQTVASVREYDSLRDRTQEEIKDLFSQLVSQQELLKLFRAEIVPRAEQTLKASISAYQTGRTDILMLIDNWRQLLQYRIAQQRLEAQLRQTLASLERAVGGASLTAVAADVPEDLPTPALPNQDNAAHP